MNGGKQIVFWAFAKRNLNLYSVNVKEAERKIRAGETVEDPVAKYSLLGDGRYFLLKK